MLDHIHRWNIWRKHCLNGPIHKILVLFGVIKSPSMRLAMSPEEEKEITKAFVEGYQKGLKEGELVGIEKRYTANQIREAFGLEPIKKGELSNAGSKEIFRE